MYLTLPAIWHFKLVRLSVSFSLFVSDNISKPLVWFNLNILHNMRIISVHRRWSGIYDPVYGFRFLCSSVNTRRRRDFRLVSSNFTLYGTCPRLYSVRPIAISKFEMLKSEHRRPYRQFDQKWTANIRSRPC